MKKEIYYSMRLRGQKIQKGLKLTSFNAFGLLLIIILTSLGACKDFLTEDLKGNFSSETYFKNQNQALQILNGAYNGIAFTNSNNYIWVFGDVASDDAVKGGNPGDQSEMIYIDDFTADANNGITGNYWKFAYEAIARANNVIVDVPAINMDEALKARIVGEAKFLRAYNYFNLVNIFGKVPLKLLPQVTQEAIHVPLSEVAAIYQQIEKDLTEAAGVLPGSYSTADVGRATKGAALGMLGKVSLYQQKWSEALGYFQQLNGLKIYGLLPNYADNFKLAFENSKESIFEIQHLSAQIPGVGSSLNQWFAPADNGGYFFNAPTQSLIDAYEKGSGGVVDPRLDASIGRNGQPWLNGESFNIGWSPTGYLTKKHQQPLSEVPASLTGDGGLNYIYLRYADVLLMKAEAFNEINNADSAKSNLNKVRQRARASFNGTPAADLLPDITLTDNNLLREAIRKERRVELAQEFHRHFDLMRWGKSAAESVLGENFKYEKNRYFPLPQEEIDSNQAI